MPAARACWRWRSGGCRPIFSSLVIFLEAMVAASLAWLILGEPVTAFQMLGGALILAGIWVARPKLSGDPMMRGIGLAAHGREA